MEFKGIGKEWDLAEINITYMKQITVFCSDPKQVIAHIYLPDYEITPELKANGNLISKSPELLFNLNISNEMMKSVLELFGDKMAMTTKFGLTVQIEANDKLIKEATEI